MQVVILCGGTGTRLKEQTEFLPKPLIPIGPYPMCVHIMKWYAKFGFNDFILALGYKQEAFKQYFYHYDIINHDVLFRTGITGTTGYEGTVDKWSVILSDTGLNTLKGGRLKRVEKYIQGNVFMVTYGDGIGDVDLNSLLAFHLSHGKIVTITGVHPVPRFGELCHEGGRVLAYKEKQHGDGCLTNGGFMVMSRKIFDYLTPDCDLEYGVFELLAAKGDMMVLEHSGQWRCLDTLNDMTELQRMWDEGKAKWRV